MAADRAGHVHPWLVIGSAGKSTPTTTVAAPTAPTVTTTATVTGAAAPAPPAQTVTVTVTPAAPPPPPGPATSFADGTLVVGTDIQPGTYKAPNPNGSCYFARLKGTSGGFDDIITNGNPSGPVTVTIKATDKAFESSRCGGWTKVG